MTKHRRRRCNKHPEILYDLSTEHCPICRAERAEKRVKELEKRLSILYDESNGGARVWVPQCKLTEALVALFPTNDPFRYNYEEYVSSSSKAPLFTPEWWVSGGRARPERAIIKWFPSKVAAEQFVRIILALLVGFCIAYHDGFNEGRSLLRAVLNGAMGLEEMQKRTEDELKRNSQGIWFADEGIEMVKNMKIVPDHEVRRGERQNGR